MKDWQKIAQAMGVPLTDSERVVSTLEALDQAFRPLAAKVPLDAEPASMFRPLDGDGQ